MRSAALGGRHNTSHCDTIADDAAGNLTGDGTHTYQYDAEGRLKSIDNGSYGTFVYDALGQRVEFKWNGDGSDYVRDAAGHDVAYYDPDFGYWKNWMAPRGTGYLAFSGNGGTIFSHTNHLGSTTVFSDWTGAEVQDEVFYPWGQVWSKVGNFSNGLFASLSDWDGGNLDVYVAEHRLYSATVGRWLSPDSAGMAAANPANPQSWNRYAYVLNNPANLVDPSGLYTHQGCTDPSYAHAHSFCYDPDPIPGCGTTDPFYSTCDPGPWWGLKYPEGGNVGGGTPPPKPKPKPTITGTSLPPQQYKDCVSKAKAVENKDLKEAVVETAIGGATLLGSFAVVPYLAAQGVFEGIEGAANAAHFGPVFVVPFLLYGRGVIAITAAFNQYDASVAKCQDKYGVYPSGG